MERNRLPCAGEKRRKLLCGHCSNFLSKSTYYRHRTSYFNARTNVWMTESDAEVQSNSDSSNEEDNIDSTPDDSITDVDLDPEKGNN